MEKEIKKIRELIKKKCEKNDWKYHILPVVQYAKELADAYKADKDLVELAALMHDVGRIMTEDSENHHVSGIPEAEKILKKHGFADNVIKEIKHCIASHRSGKGIKPKSMVAKIIANADAMAHFDNFPILIFLGAQKGFKYEEMIKWIDKKLKRDWNEKITLPRAKIIMQKKYKAISLIIDSARKYT